MSALRNIIEFLKEKADKTWDAYEHINGCFPIDKRDDSHEYLIREARARWSAWNNAYLKAVKEERDEIESQINEFNTKHNLN